MTPQAWQSLGTYFLFGEHQIFYRDEGAGPTLLLIPRLIRYMKERSTYRDRWGGRMPASSVPMRFINGSTDPISGAHVADFYESYMPAADVVRLVGIGHYPQVEAPEAVLQHFLDFVKR